MRTPDILGQTVRLTGAAPIPPALSRTAVEAHLERILSSEAFAQSENLTRFLRSMVDRALSGKTDQIKEYLVGVEVFGRGENFDPKEDTIVRVQARNLRSKLRAYYETSAASDPILIDLPTGSYVPGFR